MAGTWKKILLEGDSVPASSVTPGAFPPGGYSMDALGVDAINERSSDHGVLIDGLLVKDGAIPQGITAPDEYQLSLFRPQTAPSGGSKVFLELAQVDQNPPVVPVTYPFIRFHHYMRHWERIEGRPDGFHLLTGDGGAYVGLKAGGVTANGGVSATGPIVSSAGGYALQASGGWQVGGDSYLAKNDPIIYWNGGLFRLVSTDDYSTCFALDPAGNLSLQGSLTAQSLNATPFGCRVKRAGSEFTLPNNALTAIPYDTEIHDTDACWAPSAPTRFYAQRAGYYSAGAAVSFYAAGIACRMWLGIRKNGSVYLGADETHVIPNQSCEKSVSHAMFWLNAGEYVEFYAYQNSGGNLNVRAATPSYEHWNSAYFRRVV